MRKGHAIGSNFGKTSYGTANGPRWRFSEVAQVIGCRPESIIDFSTNISPYGLPQSVRSTALSSLYYLDQYPDPDLSTLEQN